MLRAAPAGYCHIIETRGILMKEVEIIEQKMLKSPFFFNNT